MTKVIVPIHTPEKEFEIVIDEDAADDFHSRQEALWDAKEENMQVLSTLADETVMDMEFEADEFDAANDALAEYLEEME